MYNKPQGAQDQFGDENFYLRARIEELEKKLLKQDELEQMVEESEHRFKQILSLTYDGIILYERNTGEIIEANIRLIHKMKYRRDDVIGKNVFKFVSPEQRDIVMERLTEDLPNVYEITVLDNDGKSYEFEICSRSCQFQGRKVKMAAVCDISYRKRYEKTIRESEEKFRSLCENTKDSIILTDRNEILHVNFSTPEIFGLSDEQPIVNLSQVMEYIHPADRSIGESLIRLVLLGQKKTKSSQFRLVVKDGTERWIWCRIFPVAPDDPNDHKLVMVSSDFTDIHEKKELQKKTEIAAKTAEEKYQLLTSLLPEMIFETDISGQVTFANIKALDVFEYGSDIYPNHLCFLELIGVDDKQMCLDYIQKMVVGEVTVPKVDCVAITKSGRKFPVTFNAKRLYLNNEFVGLSIIMLDNTNQKSAEQETLNYKENMTFLSKSALKFLSFSSDDDIFIFIGKSLSKFASKSVIVVFSFDQSANTSNIRFISGIYPHINNLIEILGKPPEDFHFTLPSKFRNKYLSEKNLKKIDGGLINVMTDDWSIEKIKQIQKLLNVDKFYSMGVVRDNKLYGGLLIASDSKAAPFDTQTIETFIFQAGIALHRKQIDNELYKAKVAAEESDRLKSAFLANMSHEVRTPLNGILGISQVLLKTKDLAPNIQSDVKMIVESGSSLLALIEDIMDVSKIEAGQMKIKYKPFHLNALMDQLYSMFQVHPLYLQKNAEAQNIELLYEKSDENIAMMSDPDRLQQIFVNLIGNALKFTQKGSVQFGYTISKQLITFYVRDSGIGIPKDKTEKIFERFTQVDNTLARKFSGPGLGLAISKGLTTLLNGKIWCESNLGKGSCFYFSIPYHPTSMLEDAATPKRRSARDYDWSNYTILIVEDDLINYKVIEAMLRNTKVKMLHADNGLKAIDEVCANQGIDLVLMDVHLPEMSGLEATKYILDINPTLPIIAQTANAMAEDKDKCLEAGCSDYISKPIDMGNLYTKIAKYLPDEPIINN
jgi:PAS domain S-box-containing protein